MYEEEAEEEAVHIPTDSLEEILHRLPSNDLLNFKLVSKEWLDLISSPKFIQKHLERSKADLGGDRLLHLSQNDSDVIDMEENIAKKIPLRHVKSFLGSCDGLVLCGLFNGKIAAVNPSTRRCAVRTPCPSLHNAIEGSRWLFCSWFGHHPSTGEYVLVLARLVRPSTIHFEVYTLSRNINNPVLSFSDHHLADRRVNLLGKIGTFLHGRLHCPVRLASPFEVLILVHSFRENGSIDRMSCPDNCCPTLGVIDGCLSIISLHSFRDDVYVVWTMKEYGVEKSWTKLANIVGYTITSFNPCCWTDVPLLFCRNGYVILKGDGSRIVKYSFGRSETKIFKARSYYRCDQGIICIDSLVSPHSLVLGEKEEITLD